MKAFWFTLDEEFERLNWGHLSQGSDKPELTNEQAMVIAVASVASALDNVALQIHQLIGPVQEIAGKSD